MRRVGKQQPVVKWRRGAITRFLGSLDLTRIWSRYAFRRLMVAHRLYSYDWSRPSQIHEMAAAQRYAWRWAVAGLRQAYYLPEGSFRFQRI